MHMLKLVDGETYPNRSVPRIFTKYINSIDKIFPILKIAVTYKIFSILEAIKCEVVVNMTGTLKITSITKL